MNNIRVLKSFISILCIVSFFTVGEMGKIKASMASDTYYFPKFNTIPEYQANIGIIEFPFHSKNSTVESFKSKLESNFYNIQEYDGSILQKGMTKIFSNSKIKFQFWEDEFNQPTDERLRRMDVVLIALSAENFIDTNSISEFYNNNFSLWWNWWVTSVNLRQPKLMFAIINGETFNDNSRLAEAINKAKEFLMNSWYIDRDQLPSDITICPSDEPAYLTLLNVNLIRDIKTTIPLFREIDATEVEDELSKKGGPCEFL